MTSKKKLVHSKKGTSSTKKNTTSDRIKELASKKGVTIFLDFNENSDLANMGSCYSYEKNDKILEISANLLHKVDKDLLHEIIRKVHEDGELLWKSTKKQVLLNYTEYAKAGNSSDKNILQFFTDVMPKGDYDALKMALYLRDQNAKGRDISVYRKDIRDRFGERGTNISNLCSAGYFDSEFQKLYNEVSKEEFKEYYEIAVGKKARALFVNVHMDEDQIQQEFEVMLAKAIKYHMSEFRIHGKGKTNVVNIKKFITNLQITAEDSFTIKKVYDDEKLTAIEYIVEIAEK